MSITASTGGTGPPTPTPSVALGIKIAGGAAIPAIATLIFNFINFFVDNYGKQTPEVSESIYDIAVGCAFAILGICLTVTDRSLTLKLVILLIALILCVLGGNVLYLAAHLSRLGLVLIVNVISFLGLAWAIYKAG